MSNKFSRRDFLKATGAAGAASLLPLSVMPSFAQGSELSFATWGHFITTQNSLLESLTKGWSEESGTDIAFTYGGFDTLADTLATAAATGGGPDMTMMLHAHPHQFAETLVDVSDVCEELGEANGGWYDIGPESCMVDGVWRAMPWYFAAHAMVYREDILAEAGYEEFPDTWEGVLEAGTKIKGMELPPFGFSTGRAGGDGNNFVFSVLWSFGAGVTDPDGNITLDSAETRQAIEFVEQLYHDAMDPSTTTWDDGSNNQAFLAGNVSCTNNASSVLWAGRRNNIEFIDTVNHAGYPSGPAGRILFVQIHTLGIMNFAKDIDAAKDLLRYINSEDVWLPLGVDSFAFNAPMFRNYEEHPAMPWNFDPKLAAFKGLAADGHTMGYPATPTAEASQVASNFVILDMFGSVNAGAASIDEAIATAVEQVEEIYAG
jgi:multiple sugar transport system substrate-binding protein